MTLYAIDNSTTTIAMGHLEVKGFEMHKALRPRIRKTQFNKFEKVLSGQIKKSDDGHLLSRHTIRNYMVRL